MIKTRLIRAKECSNLEQCKSSILKGLFSVRNLNLLKSIAKSFIPQKQNDVESEYCLPAKLHSRLPKCLKLFSALSGLCFPFFLIDLAEATAKRHLQRTRMQLFPK